MASSTNTKNLRNLRCRRMLNLVNDVKDAYNNIPREDNTPNYGLLADTSEHIQSRQSSGKVVCSSIENENTASDEDFSPDTSEYMPSRSPSPDSSPEVKSQSHKLSKIGIRRNILSRTNSANSSLTNTPKHRRLRNLNFIASPTVLYAINDALPEISNIESFLRNVEQLEDEPSILRPLQSQTERESDKPGPGLSREFQLHYFQPSEDYPVSSQLLIKTNNRKVVDKNTHPPHLQTEIARKLDEPDPRTPRENFIFHECQLSYEDCPMPSHSALETDTPQVVDQNTQPLHLQAEMTRESDEPNPKISRDNFQLHECQLSPDDCSVPPRSTHETDTLQVVGQSTQSPYLQFELTRASDEPDLITSREQPQPQTQVVSESNNNAEPSQLLNVSQDEQCQVLDTEIPTNRSRKRVKNKKDWIDVINKRLKNSGKPYISIRSKKAREEKHMRETCTCKRQCKEKIDEGTRTKIFNLYWSIGNHEKQWDFILKYISSNSIKKMQLIRKNNRTQTIIYELPCNLDNMTDKIVVCKNMFLGTLGITEKVVYTAIEKKNTAMTDLRGTHLNRPKKMSEQTERSIVDHIKSFPVVESHYTRKDSSRLYLNETLNQSKMYRLYKEWYNSTPENEAIKMASKSQYELVFNTRFNYSFFCPKKDMCEQCAVYYNADTERKAQLQEAFEKHREEKETVRKMKDLEKALFDKSTMTVACFDLEKVLHIPQSEVSSFYYKRKYAVYNFTIYNVLTKKGYCYLWHYQIAKRGANDIASCLYHYIKQEVSEAKCKISFYSDSCSGQNRNRIVFAMYQYASRTFGVDITHRFFVKGHSQSEGDTMHSCIERAKKRHTIYTPDQMYCIIENAKVTGEKFKIKEMQQSNFYNFKNLVSDKTKNWFQDDNSEKIFWSKIREIKIDSATPDKIYFRNSLEDEYKSMTTSRQVSRRRKNMPTSSENSLSLQPAYDQLITVPRPLYNDLISLCDSEAIPLQYQEFYRKLVPQNQSSGAATALDSDIYEDDD